MPTHRCGRHSSVLRPQPSPSITTLDVVSCDPCVGAPDLWYRPGGRVEVRAGARLTPAALVQLASACYALRQAGQHPVLRADDAAVHEYLGRCALLAVVEPVVTIEPPGPGALAPPRASGRQASPLLLDVTRLETSADLPPLLDQILWVLRQRLRYRTDDAYDVTTAISELCQNIFDHNAQTDGFVAIQVTGRRGYHHLEVGVADYGAGLAATLRRNPQQPPLASDLDAIHLAVQRGTSAYADPTRGTGLYHLLALIATQAGAVQICSGTATVHYHLGQGQAWMGTVPWRPGVHVVLTLPLPGGA